MLSPGRDLNPRPAAYKCGSRIVKEVFRLLRPFLTNSFFDDFYEWLVNDRGISSRRWARDLYRYAQKPLDLSKRHSIRAYRLLLIYLNEKYGIDVSHLLQKLKLPKTGRDLRIPSETQVLQSYKKIKKLNNETLEIIFLALVFSGARLSEVTKMLNEFTIENIELKQDVALYVINWRRGSKDVYYIFMPKWLAKRLKRLPIGYEYYQTMSKRHDLVRAKYIRKFVAQKLYDISENRDIVNFVQGRSFSNEVIFTHYVMLLNKSLKYYKKYASWLKEFLQLK